MRRVVADELERLLVLARQDAIEASYFNGVGKVGSLPSSLIATAFFASDGEMIRRRRGRWCRSRISRLEPSGNVREIISMLLSLTANQAGKMDVASVLA